jgi:SAM-dependent methyltransferase
MSMALEDEYRHQLRWRAWDTILDALPGLAGTLVYDLGCGIGDQAALLTGRGARVVGIDANEALLAVARARMLPAATFVAADLRRTDAVSARADGLWCSFVAAYLPDLTSVLTAWRHRLQPGGWLALTEIDDLFGHEPLRAPVRELLDRFANESLDAGRYDFRMGRKLAAHAVGAGFEITRTLTVPDAELSFDGPASSDVLIAWQQRFDRMRGLQRACGDRFERVRDEFLGALARPDHRATARVHSVIATLRAFSSEK